MAGGERVNDDNGKRIVRRWQDLAAPTGEGRCYQTLDGRTWKQVVIPNLGTGDEVGYLRNGKIEPR